MEVVQEWRGGVDVTRKTGAASWGADAQKLMHVMMGQLGGDQSQEEVTLDLLGRTGHVDEFLEVDTDREPMPSGWEKCLDLKTGELYFVSKSMGMRTSEDPRKQPPQQQGMIAPRTPARPAHEFLASKKEETLRASTSGSSSGEQDHHVATAVVPPVATGRRLWNLQVVDDRTAAVHSPESNLELNLNLSPSSPPVAAAHTSQAAVCTMEMVQQALKRTEKAMGKREAPSSSFSAGSLASWTTGSRSSPSTSSSSTSKSVGPPAQPRVNYEAETSSSGAAVELAMGKCARCSMMVMVHKKDPKCPGCESLDVGFVSFGAANSSAKRQRLDQAAVQSTSATGDHFFPNDNTINLKN